MARSKRGAASKSALTAPKASSSPLSEAEAAAPRGVAVGRRYVFGGGAHMAVDDDGVTYDAWPQASRVPATRKKLAHPALPAIVDQVRRGDAWLIIRARTVGLSARRLIEASVEQSARLDPSWAIAIVAPIAALLAEPARARLTARVGPDAIIIDVRGRPLFVGFEHWGPVTSLLPSTAWTSTTPVQDDSFALTATLFHLLLLQSPTPEREQLARLDTLLSVVDEPWLRDALALLFAKNLQAQPALRHTTAELAAALADLAARLPAVDAADLAQLVRGTAPELGDIDVDVDVDVT